MKKEELYEEIDTRESFTQKYLGLSLVKFFTLIAVVVGIGIYIGILLYGTNSIDVLLDLQEYEAYLKDEVGDLKVKNAELQREYFELKEISVQ